MTTTKLEENYFLLRALLLVLLAMLIGCQSAYYTTMEKFGYHKRDLMVDRVQDARDSQEEAVEQFESALEQFKSVVDFDGGSLQKKYDFIRSMGTEK